MSAVASVVDGVIQDTTTTSSSSSSSSSSSLDKDAFLQLLVAEMKYQDPLEPTSSTEYIAQLAQFSTLEEMQNMTDSIDLQRASALVGKEVYVEVTNSSTGATSTVYGKVNYVTYESGEAYVNIDGTDYSLDDVTQVYDSDYTEAYSLAYNWTVLLNSLPSVSNITLDNEDDITELQETYEGMTTYQKTFIVSDNVDKMEEYVARLEVLKAEEEEESEETEETDDTEETEEVEETE